MEANWEIWKNTEIANLVTNKENSAVTMKMVDDDTVSLALLSQLCEATYQQMSNDVDVYSKEFPEYVLTFVSNDKQYVIFFTFRFFNIGQLSVSKYYTKLSKEVHDIFTEKNTVVSLSTFTIYGKLMEIHKRFESQLQNYPFPPVFSFFYSSFSFF